MDTAKLKTKNIDECIGKLRQIQRKIVRIPDNGWRIAFHQDTGEVEMFNMNKRKKPRKPY